MKQVTNRDGIKAIFATIMLCLLTGICRAQDNTTVKIDGEPIGSWMSRNWMWVAGGAVLLILLIGILSSGGSRKRSKTTIVREEDASGIIRTTTTEIKE